MITSFHQWRKETQAVRGSAALAALLLGACANTQDLPAPSRAAPARILEGAEAVPLPLDLAIEAARLAVSTCLDAGYATTVLVTNLDGQPIAILSAPGANPRTHQIAPTKVAIVRKYGVPSSEIVVRARSDEALAAEIAADPAIGMARGGALPLVRSGERVGYIAVSGAPSGDQDETCAIPASQVVAAR